MKSILFNLILIWLCFSAASAAQAQSDSVRTEYKTEDEKISSAEVKRFIRYITRVNVEEKTLLKVGVWPGISNDNRSSKPLFNVGISAETSVERKLSPAFSLYAGINYALHYTQYERVLLNAPIVGLSDSYDRRNNFTLTPKVGARYYYAMAAKVREGRAANNFSGNYVSFQVERYLIDRQRTSYYNLVTGDSRTGLSDYVNEQPVLSVFWGVQRRLGRLGYVDLSAGPSFRSGSRKPLLPGSNFKQVTTGRSMSLQLNALVGLGW